MTSARSPSLNVPSIYIQPRNFADYLSNQQDYCLFLDIDGTLSDFTFNPKDSVIPNTTLMLLKKIQSYGVKIAIVTGRSLSEARQMLSPIQLPIAATHGLEIAFDGKKDNDDTNVAQVDIIELDAIRQALIQSCLPYDDFAIEDKPYSVALHYRQNPALADMAYSIMSRILKNYANWILKKGKYVWEIVPKGVNKGKAILTLLKKMQTSNNLCAIFIGDDITDEAGFMAVQGDSRLIENNNLIEENRSTGKNHKLVKGSLNGMGIKVGSEPTCAHYYLHSIHEVTVLLDSFLTFYQKRATLAFELADANFPTAKKTTRHVI
ncbi:trehalose-phosphatase [Psychrobacter sp. 72-O-c]|uniref:trehalose-phosphatase n=1 Tax=Psychrobacter sp. 72-O-c TaxID=2774125 RepID=UPI001918A685|nr:trehalose-phosphatase [Psychrobacter sp. 72-O-c]